MSFGFKLGEFSYLQLGYLIHITIRKELLELSNSQHLILYLMRYLTMSERLAPSLTDISSSPNKLQLRYDTILLTPQQSHYQNNF